MKFAARSLLFWLSLALIMPLPCGAESYTATVISITDGDTMIVSHNGDVEKIRLADVDAPEKKQPFGQAAKKCLSDLAFMREVNVESIGKDRYGRTLAYIRRSDGVDINESLLKSGHAWVYRAKSKRANFKEAEKNARSQHVGLWRDDLPIAPWTYRHTQRKVGAETVPIQRATPDNLIRELLRERIKPTNYKRKTSKSS